MSTLAARLKKAMELRGLNTYRLAKDAGLDISNLSRLVRGGRASAKHETVTSLAQALRVRVEWLSHGELPMETESSGQFLRDRPEWPALMGAVRQLHPDLLQEELDLVGALHDVPGVWTGQLDAPAVAGLATTLRDWQRRLAARPKLP